MNALKSQKKLLYVDDDDMSLISLKRLLREEYDIDIAQNPEEAFELAEKHDYDAVLMDIALSEEINGIELTEKIRKINRYRKKPFIALTAFASNSDKLYFLSHGLDYYISKPFFKKDILALLNRVFMKKVEDRYANSI